MEIARAEWVQVVVRECQALVGDLLPDARTALRPLLDSFIGRVPEPRSHVERVFLRGLLLDTALYWGGDYHQMFHRRFGASRCTLVTSDITARSWRNSQSHPKDVFRRWAVDYAAAFVRTHPLHCALDAQRVIDTRFAEPLRLGELARIGGVSPRQLREEFVKLTGMNVQAYLRTRRIDAAARLLRDTDDKVEWIARKVGWKSRKNLNLALKDACGLTPAGIRRLSASTRGSSVPTDRE